ncbi:MAG TPA: phage portal protein [Pirellulales bacterium]|nr:phage portal protein [Pirellulales bacterium]
MNLLTAGTIDVSSAGVIEHADAPAPSAPRRPAQNETRGRRATSKKLRQAAIREVAQGNPDRLLAQTFWGTGTSYRDAAQTRMNRDWVTGHMSGDMAIFSSWDTLIRRARDLVRNEPWARAAINKIALNVVGEGIRTESEIEFDDGTLDDETNAQIDAAFEHWAMHEADAAGQLTWYEIQQLAMAETPESGEVFLVACHKHERNRSIPLCFQVIEPEQLFPGYDWPGDWVQPGGNPVIQNRDKIKRGIKFDKWGAPQSYHFWSDHPYDIVPSLQMRPVILEAARVIHYFAKTRPSLTRGITWFHNILQAMRDLGEYLGDEMAAARIGSLFVAAVKREAGAGTGLGLEDDSTSTDIEADTGNPLVNLGPGIVADLGPNDSVEQINPTRPNKDAGAFLSLILNSMANGVGLSYIGLTADVSKANFSSARFARQADKKFWQFYQANFGRRVVLNVRQRVVEQLIALDRIPSLSPNQLAANRDRWLCTRLLPPGWDELDPAKDIDAAIARIRAGLSTLQEECAGRGRNWRKVLVQRFREREFARELGLNLSVDQLPSLPKIASPAPAQAVESDEAADDVRDDVGEAA